MTFMLVFLLILYKKCTNTPEFVFMTEKQRNEKGQFVSGHSSGNNKPKRLLETMDGRNVFEMARNVCPEILEAMYKIAMNPREKSLVRVTAGNSILDRGMGKAVSRTIVQADVASMDIKEIDITQLSEEKLMNLIAQHEQKNITSDVIDGEYIETDE